MISARSSEGKLVSDIPVLESCVDGTSDMAAVFMLGKFQLEVLMFAAEEGCRA